MSEERIRQGVGSLTVAILSDVLSGLPGVKSSSVSSLPAVDSLSKGNLEAAKRIVVEVAPLIQASCEEIDTNPFYNDPKAVARSLVGGSIMRISRPGVISAGLITKAAAYTGEGDNAESFGNKLFLPSQESGIMGTWRSKQRGGYSVACISAHHIGNQGYVAIWGVTLAGDLSERIGMKEIAETFRFEEITGDNLLAPNSNLKISLRAHPRRNVTENTRVYSESTEGKGKGCVGVYELRMSQTN